MLKDASDGELVAIYVQDRSERAMRELVTRHHDRLYARFMMELRNEADANDLLQQLWLQVTRNIDNYRDEGKFAHYLSRIASNLLNDFWRQRGRRSEVFIDNLALTGSSSGEEDGVIDMDRFRDDSLDEEARSINEELVMQLVSVLVPALPLEQRTAWLLRHESEYWEPGTRLDWRHLAQLCGLSTEAAWQLFESARGKLMQAATHTSRAAGEPVDDEELAMFLIWSQAQRMEKSQSFTWDYFAKLLNVPTNTMKTRYRAAQKQLNDGLKAFLGEHDD